MHPPQPLGFHPLPMAVPSLCQAPPADGDQDPRSQAQQQRTGWVRVQGDVALNQTASSILTARGGPILCPVPVQGSGYTGVTGSWRWSRIPAPLGFRCLPPGSFPPRRHLPAHPAPTPPAYVRPERSWAGEGIVTRPALCGCVCLHACVCVHSAPWARLADTRRATVPAHYHAGVQLRGVPLQLQQQGLCFGSTSSGVLAPAVHTAWVYSNH
ncbi:neurobeachin [Platysternon megacephalum]|uniref:Neurobeachin n=1 Tax=Platysternon megacephalum TaxID=55544 RepID=A0A4D9EGQ7_9SAUR|nr:neurobeachin [Platysternon megacephalum]